MLENQNDVIIVIHNLKKQINEFLDRSIILLSQTTDDITDIGGEWEPPADIIEFSDSLKIFLELPGVSVQNLDIRLNGKILQIKGKRVEPWNNLENTNVIISERKFMEFEKLLHIEDSIDEDNISSTLKNGVLSIVLPKRKPKKIDIGG